MYSNMRRSSNTTIPYSKIMITFICTKTITYNLVISTIIYITIESHASCGKMKITRYIVITHKLNAIKKNKNKNVSLAQIKFDFMRV